MFKQVVFFFVCTCCVPGALAVFASLTFGIRLLSDSFFVVCQSFFLAQLIFVLFYFIGQVSPPSSTTLLWRVTSRANPINLLHAFVYVSVFLISFGVFTSAITRRTVARLAEDKDGYDAPKSMSDAIGQVMELQITRRFVAANHENEVIYYFETIGLFVSLALFFIYHYYTLDATTLVPIPDANVLMFRLSLAAATYALVCHHLLPYFVFSQNQFTANLGDSFGKGAFSTMLLSSLVNRENYAQLFQKYVYFYTQCCPPRDRGQ